MKYLLSICIPTYNRARELAATLRRLEPLLLHNAGVQICVSDNCSSDGTRALLKKYEKMSSRFKSSSNRKNMGFDVNMQTVIGLADGKWVLPVSDDDEPSAEKLGGLLSLLSSLDESYSLGLTGSFFKEIEGYFDKKEYSLEGLLGVFKRILSEKPTCVFGYMSNFCFKKSLVKKAPHQPYHSFYHLYLFSQFISQKNGRAFLFNEPIIRQTGGSICSTPDGVAKLYVNANSAVLKNVKLELGLKEVILKNRAKFTPRAFAYQYLKMIAIKGHIRTKTYGRIMEKMLALKKEIAFPPHLALLQGILETVERVELLRVPIAAILGICFSSYVREIKEYDQSIKVNFFDRESS